MTAERVEIGGLRHYRTPAGLFPSVTTILKETATAESRAVIESWKARVGPAEAERVRVAAADRGSGLHAKIEAWLTASRRHDPDTLFPGCPWWQSVLPFLRTVKRGLLVEHTVWNAEVGYAGNLDALVEVRSGKVILADWKTANRPRRKEWIRDYFLQGAAYAHGDGHGHHVDHVAIVVAYEDRPATTHIMSDRELTSAWEEFKGRARDYHAAHTPPALAGRRLLVLGDRRFDPVRAARVLDRIHERVGVRDVMSECLGPAAAWCDATGCPIYSIKLPLDVDAVVVFGHVPAGQAHFFDLSERVRPRLPLLIVKEHFSAR